MDKIRKFDNSIYRLVISNIIGYGEFPITTSNSKRSVGLCPQLDNLKKRVLDHLLHQQNKRKIKPMNWSIAWEIHPGSGLPHLDLLIIFERNVQVRLTSFDYLIKDLGILQAPSTESFTAGHVWITPYSPKRINKALLDYGEKQDPSVITNMTAQSKEQLVRLNQLKDDPYLYLQNQMRKDPINFNLQQYCQQNDLYSHISAWSSIKAKLRDSQVAAANLLLKSSPGFAPITQELIQAKLTPEQLKLYDSWEGYSTIVSYLNQILFYGCKRPFKSKQLLLVGRPNAGKTTLVRKLQQFCATYHLDVSNWYPHYRDGIYSLMSWDQFKLKGGKSHTDLLKFLQGSPMDLEYKGGSSLRQDNQLIIMTSNMDLKQHIDLKFKDDLQRDLASKNLKVRIEQIKIPKFIDLFLLLKLICKISH